MHHLLDLSSFSPASAKCTSSQESVVVFQTTRRYTLCERVTEVNTEKAHHTVTNNPAVSSVPRRQKHTNNSRLINATQRTTKELSQIDLLLTVNVGFIPNIQLSHRAQFFQKVVFNVQQRARCHFFERFE
jgi:hypothetical protein